jgi:hypothetical protein
VGARLQDCKTASVQGKVCRVAGGAEPSRLRAQGWSKAQIEEAEKAAAGERTIVEIDE